MNKYKTNIKGLDILFHGGLQIDNSLDDIRTNNTRCGKQRENDGLVIVIRGAKGTNKTTLALQLMNGLYKSIHSKEERDERINALFYSINKDKKSLNDSFLDMIISGLLKDIIRQYRIDQFNSTNRCDLIVCREDIQNVLEFIFDFDNKKSDNRTRSRASRVNQEIGNDLPKLICEGIIVYNSRTNALHYKRTNSNDDLDNLVATRRHDTIQEYIHDLSARENQRLLRCKHPVIKDFTSNILSVLFNADEKTDLQMDTPMSPIIVYQAIETDIYKKSYKIGVSIDNEDINSHSDSSLLEQEILEAINKKKTKYDILVIDGFSQLSNNNLENLPFSNLTDVARRLAKISILVFDDREGSKCDGDIVIDMHYLTDPQEEYMYHELRIAKSVFQTYVLGWHQYKKREEGIEVFPSVHLLLSKRFYIFNKSNRIGQDIFESSYNQYLDAKQHMGCIKNDVQDCPVETPYLDYLKNSSKHAEELMKYTFEMYANMVNTIGAKPSENYYQKIFENVLFFDPSKNGLPTMTNECNISQFKTEYLELTDHFPSTAIIGNPNSYKRTLAMATTYKLAQQGIHTLFIFLDKDEMDMRRHMVCPGYHGKYKKKLNNCIACSKFIHTYNFRMGCISAEEFFSILLEQISFFCTPTEKTDVETKYFHIVIDDIQKIDFSFPFLKATNLFLSALLTICHNHNVKLTILCDKSASLTHELCSLVDNVIVIRRDCDNVYDIELNIERDYNNIVPSRITQFTIKDFLHLFTCDGSYMGIDPILTISNEDGSTSSIRRIIGKEIGSMKEYWRQTINHIHKDN